MNYKEHDVVVLEVNGVFKTGTVLSTEGLSPHNVIVVEDCSNWIFVFDQDGTEMDYSAKLYPLTKLHKILLGIK